MQLTSGPRHLLLLLLLLLLFRGSSSSSEPQAEGRRHLRHGAAIRRPPPPCPPPSPPTCRLGGRLGQRRHDLPAAQAAERPQLHAHAHVLSLQVGALGGPRLADGCAELGGLQESAVPAGGRGVGGMRGWAWVGVGGRGWVCLGGQRGRLGRRVVPGRGAPHLSCRWSISWRAAAYASCRVRSAPPCACSTSCSCPPQSAWVKRSAGS